MSATLYHFTCSHAAPEIVATGHLIPNVQPLIPGRPELVWLTDLPEPDQHGLGLTSTILSCDRTERRFRVVIGPGVQTFDEWADEVALPGPVYQALTEGRMPEHWWVSAHPVVVVEDPIGDESFPDDDAYIDSPALGRVRPYGNRAT